MLGSMSLAMLVAACCFTGIVVLLVIGFSFRRPLFQHQRRPGAALRKILSCEEDQAKISNIELGLPRETSRSSISSQWDASNAAVVSARPVLDESTQLSKNKLPNHFWKPKKSATGVNNGNVSNAGKAMIAPQDILLVRSDHGVLQKSKTHDVTTEISASLPTSTKIHSAVGYRSNQWKQTELPVPSGQFLSRHQASSVHHSINDMHVKSLNERVVQSTYSNEPSSGKSVMVGKRLRSNLGNEPMKFPRTLSRTAYRSMHVDGSLPMVGREALEAILHAQDGGLPYYPEYEQALYEIRQGHKRSCWMWYIWPSMQGIRSHRMPQLLLPSLEGAIAYLNHEILRTRLIEITSAADEVLSTGLSATLLFGGELDSIKVHEACTFFGIAAVATNRMEDAVLFVRLVQHHYEGLNETVMTHFQNDNTTDQRLLSLVSQIANQYSRL